MKKIRVLVVGCGNMGFSHALAYHQLKNFEICGLVSRGNSNRILNEKLKTDYPLFNNYEKALQQTSPDAVCISTYPETHEKYTLKALQNNCDCFVEKPLSTTVKGTQKIIKLAKRKNKKVVVGYILRHHPAWVKFVELAKELGTPLVMRMNLNQQSKSNMWETHKQIMKTMSPIVDCGVHYVDIMCQMTQSAPKSVSAIGAKLTPEISSNMYNYGNLQVVFEDKSVGWYEAGWGPMMSETAFFIKDIIGPKGSVSIVAEKASAESESDNVDLHTQTESIKIHYAELNSSKEFAKKDKIIKIKDEPNHNLLCKKEQEYFYDTIAKNIDLTNHWNDAINSLKIVIAADKSFRKNKTIKF